MSMKGLARKVWYHTMKATHSTRRRALCAVTAAALSAVMLVSVSCTRNDGKDDPKDSTSGTTAGTTAGTTGGTTGGMTDQTHETGKLLDPDAGTVSPDAEPGDPPAGADSGRGMRSRFMR